MKKKFTKEELFNLVDDGEQIACESWRWGTNETYVFPFENKYWKITIQVHSQDGWQIYGDQEATEVKPFEKTVIDWVEVNEN